MKIRVVGKIGFALGASLLFLPLCAGQTAIAGDWQGVAEHDGQLTHVTLHITADNDGHLAVTVDAPERGASDVPADTVTLKDSKFIFAVDAAPGTYAGTVDKDATAITGSWSEQGTNTALNFKRVSAPMAVAIVGDWQGMVDHGDRQTHVILHLSAGQDSVLSAKIDAIAPDTSGASARNVVLKDSQLTFAIDAAPGTYAGTVNSDATEIAGTWSSKGKDVALNFKRASGAVASSTSGPAASAAARAPLAANPASQ